MVEITAIHLDGGTRHEHIASVKWRNPSTSKVGTSSRATMVDWLRDATNRAYVTDGQHTVSVGVVDGKTPYIRTHKDGVWTDNLLALPQF